MVIGTRRILPESAAQQPYMTSDKPESTTPPLIIGACEWVALPELGLPRLRARVDTGAKTCSLHASSIEIDSAAGEVSFTVYIGSPRGRPAQQCVAPLVGQRQVTNPGGRTELRAVIQTVIGIGDRQWPVEVTLSDRSDMRFRMLLGRSAMRGHCLVDPGHTYMQGHPAFRIPTQAHNSPFPPSDEASP